MRANHPLILTAILAGFALWPCGAGAKTPDDDYADAGGDDAGEDDEGGGDADSGDQKGKGRIPMEVQARLYGLYSWQNLDDAEAKHGFSLERARLEFTFTPAKWVEAVVEAALDDVDDQGTPDDLLRDAFVDLKPRRWFAVRAGQFKKPFSLMELKSKGKLPVITRGLSNDFLVRDLGYGGRDVGVALGGRLKSPLGLEWMLGVFNGAGANRLEDDTSGAKDAAGRLEVEPLDGLKLGLNGSIRNFDLSVPGNEDKPATAWMGGGDLQLKWRGLRLQVEGLYGVNHLSASHPEAASVQALATWKIKLPRRRMSLTPVVRVDTLWPVFSERKDRAFLATAGVNWQVVDHVRLMLQVELIRADDTLASLWPEGERVFLQLTLDM